MPAICACTSVRLKPRQLDAPHTSQPVQLGEEGAQRMATVDVIGAVRREQHEAGGLHRAVEIGEQFAGGAVGPVQILQREHDRTARGQPLQKLCRQLEEPCTAVLLVERLGPRRLGASGARRQIRQQPCQLRLSAGDGGGHAGIAQRTVQAAQRGGEGRERQSVRAQFETAADGRGGSGASGGGQELLQQPRLAHSGLAAQQQRLRLARVGAGERVCEQRQLILAAYEDRADGGIVGHVAKHDTGDRHRDE